LSKPDSFVHAFRLIMAIGAMLALTGEAGSFLYRYETLG
jgi:hypothetical protein